MADTITRSNFVTRRRRRRRRNICNEHTTV